LPSAQKTIRSISHNANLLVPIAPLDWQDIVLTNDEINITPSSNSDEQYTDPAFTMDSSSHEPHFIVQKELHDLVRDLRLSKQQAELLGSRLKEWNLLAELNRNYYFSQKKYKIFWILQDGLCACTDIDGLMQELNIEHSLSEWRLFINASKFSLKAVLLHNGNFKLSISVAYSVTMKENYENMCLILEKINYKQYK